LEKKGKLNNSDNPIGRDTVGYAAKDNACFYELSSKKEELSDHQLAKEKQRLLEQ
jgi:hypothetical protein